MASELLGPSLDKMSLPEAHTNAAATMAALQAIHAAGVLHGDAHPGNCLVRTPEPGRGSNAGNVALIDFSHATTVTSQVVLKAELNALEESLTFRPHWRPHPRAASNLNLHVNCSSRCSWVAARLQRHNRNHNMQWHQLCKSQALTCWRGLVQPRLGICCSMRRPPSALYTQRHGSWNL